MAVEGGDSFESPARADEERHAPIRAGVTLRLMTKILCVQNPTVQTA
jgi:hypothetical protein